MNYEYQQSPLSKALLTGLFVGLIATVLSLAFNIFYREETRFFPTDIINVSSLIFVVNLIFVVVGALYFIFYKAFKKADLLFVIAMIALTVFCGFEAEGVQRTNDAHLNVEFRGLLLGIIIIMGIGACLIPFLFRSKKFEDNVI